MNELKPDNLENIDIFDVFKILLDGKLKIILITIISFALGLVYFINKPNMFNVSSIIKQGDDSVFIDYIPMNRILSNDQLDTYKINSNLVLHSVVEDFNKYDELISILSNNDQINESIEKLDDLNKQKELARKASMFSLIKKDDFAEVKLEWHDADEAIEIFREALDQSLINVKKKFQDDIKELADSINANNENKLETLKKEFELIESKEEGKIQRQIQYLKEQSSIARALGIKDNGLDVNSLLQTELSLIYPLMQANNVPYYLRGYSAIDEELRVYKDRPKEAHNYFSEDYFDIQSRILSLENDLVSSQLLAASKILSNDSTIDWIKIRLTFADVESQKSLFIIIAFSIIFGLFFGIIFVLITHIMQNRLNQEN